MIGLCAQSDIELFCRRIDAGDEETNLMQRIVARSTIPKPLVPGTVPFRPLITFIFDFENDPAYPILCIMMYSTSHFRCRIVFDADEPFHLLHLLHLLHIDTIPAVAKR